jgi:PAS domain-containing protein
LVVRTGDFSKMIDDGTQRGREQAVMLSGAPQILAQTILDTLREPILVLDVALRVNMANRSFYRTFRVKPEETENRLIYELGDGQWNIPKLRVLLE